MTKRKRTLLGLLAAVLALGAFPLAAVAQTEESPLPRGAVELTDEERATRLGHAKDRVMDEIDRRLNALERYDSRVEDAKHIQEEHAAKLQAEFAAAQATLTAGIEAINAAETVEELREIARPVFENTLVFALLRPKTQAVIASDALAAIDSGPREFGANLQEKLDRLAATGVDISEAQADLDSALTLVADAATAGAPVAALVIDLQPGDEIEGPLGEAKAVLIETRTQLREAKALAKGVVEFIRSHRPAPPAEG